MKNLLCLALVFVLAASSADAARLEEAIKIEAVVVTKAELRRYMTAGENDSLRPSMRVELNAAYEELKQPVYLVVRFLPDRPGHYSGELEVKIDAQPRAIIPVALHFTKGWVEYFIPLSGIVYARKREGPWELVEGSPVIATKWIKLDQK
jgi:hypothetical protein